MKTKLVIFGCGDAGELAHFYFTTDSNYEVVGFTVDAAFISENKFCGLPIVPFESVERTFPPAAHHLFVAVGYTRLNALRAEKVAAAQSKQYALATYISSRATVLTGEAFGDNCFVLEDNTIQPFAKIGRNVTLWSGNHIGHHCTIGDHCFITSHAVISGGVRVGSSCFIGVNATLRDHIEIGAECIVGAGVILLEDAAPGSVFRAAGAKPSPVPSSRLRHI